MKSKTVILLPLLLAVAFCVGCAGLPKQTTKVERLSQPPPGKALVNFHRPSTWGGGELIAIFDGNGKMLIDMPGGALFQHVAEPGENIFMEWAEQVTVVKGDLAPDKVYDIMVDIGMGWVRANINLVPMKKNDARRPRLAEFEKREKLTVGMNRNAHVEQYEAKYQEKIAEIKKDFLGGPKSSRVIVLEKDDCR